MQKPTSPSILSYNGEGNKPVADPSANNSEFPMSHVTYKIVEHDGGWAYTVSGVFSEAFATHAAALAAARRAAAEQRVPAAPRRSNMKLGRQMA